MINHAINYTAVLFLVLGGIDSLLGNRFGLGAEFEKGIMASGRLLSCMTGFIVLAPVIAQILSPVVVPAFQMIGADPSLFAGILFANDSGGAVLAMEIAADPSMGLYNGLIVASMMGCTVMFNIPLSIASTAPEGRCATVYGLLCGIITIPLGCLAGGLSTGFSFSAIMANTLPVIVLSISLALMLFFCRSAIVCALTMFGKGMLALCTAGLVIGAAQQLSGVEVIQGLGSLDEAFSIVGNICIFLAGVFPFLAAVKKTFQQPFQRMGAWLHINDTSVSSLILNLANGIPVFALLNEMDERGRMLNMAFLVSSCCAFGDHLAYTSQVAPELCSAVIIGKLVGGGSAFLLALMLSPRLLPLG